MADSDSEWTTCDSSSGSDSELGTSLELENLSIEGESSKDEVEEAYQESFRRQTEERRERLALLADRFEKRSEISEWYVDFIFINNLCSNLLRLSARTRQGEAEKWESFPCFGSDKVAVIW